MGVRKLAAACAAAAIAVGAGACTRRPAAQEYTLHGQVLAVRPADKEVVIQHDDIQGLMPGMTMPFKVRDQGTLARVTAGDFVTATLVLEGDAGWIRTLTPTGRHAPVPPGITLPHVMDPPLAAGDAIPDVWLVDQRGQPFSPQQLKGHVWALTFVYTRCPMPEFCPTLERRFQAVQRAVRSDPALGRVKLVTVSLDPAYDRPPVLAAHAQRLGADPAVWQFTTGETAPVDRFLERFGVVVNRGDGSPDAITHSMRTVVVDRNLRIARVFDGTEWTTGDLVAAIRTAVAA